MNIQTVMGASTKYSPADTVGKASDYATNQTLTYEPYSISQIVIKGDTSASMTANGYYYYIESKLTSTTKSSNQLVAETALVSWASAQDLAGGYASTWAATPT